ncbi:MAG TPA: TfoX/Sxy family protein [Saprospiraceae bacterium]|nr:TfoX/Sxy family protein [Saprospiraceae bacterium]
MAYNELLADKITEILEEKNVSFTIKKMFGGLCYMVEDKMCCGLLQDKKTEEDLFMCRVGEEAYEESLSKEDCIPMEFTGKSMKGFVNIIGESLMSKKKLSYWIQKSLDYNPKAKKRKK